MFPRNIFQFPTLSISMADICIYILHGFFFWEYASCVVEPTSTFSIPNITQCRVPMHNHFLCEESIFQWYKRPAETVLFLAWSTGLFRKWEPFTTPSNIQIVLLWTLPSSLMFVLRQETKPQTRQRRTEDSYTEHLNHLSVKTLSQSLRFQSMWYNQALIYLLTTHYCNISNNELQQGSDDIQCCDTEFRLLNIHKNVRWT